MLQRDGCMAPHSLLQGTSGRGRRTRGWRLRGELQTEEQRNPKEVLVGEKKEEKGEPHKKAPRSWKSHKEQSGNLMFPSFYRHHSLGGRGHSPFKEPKNRQYKMNNFGEAESLLSSFPLRKEITVTILGVYEVNQHSSKKKKIKEMYSFAIMSWRCSS